MFANGGISLNHESYFFTSNGRFFKSPAAGVDLRTLAAQPAATRHDGSYWIEGNELVMAWAERGRVTRSRYEGHDKGITIDSGFASRRAGFQRGWRMDGSYEGGASIGGGTSSSNTLNFRRDGTYTRGVGVVAVTSGTTSQVTTGASAAAAGTYEFDEYTLTLRENGAERRFTVFTFGDLDAAGRPASIFNEGVMMTRQ
ncbi:MAG: hypothetical protein FJ164_05765 [Gammaproteobacteria bacterium]|nr:hypothetical protein [Gammaproteobacteria bacterium]